MSMVATRKPLVKGAPKSNAHSWARSGDRRPLRPTGRGEYDNNRVQEIGSGTVGWTLNCSANSARVLSPLTAANATCALKVAP